MRILSLYTAVNGRVSLHVTTTQYEVIRRLYSMVEDILPGCPLEGFSNGPHKHIVVLVYRVGAGRLVTLGFCERTKKVISGFLPVEAGELVQPFCVVPIAKCDWLLKVRFRLASVAEQYQLVP